MATGSGRGYIGIRPRGGVGNVKLPNRVRPLRAGPGGANGPVPNHPNHGRTVTQNEPSVGQGPLRTSRT